MISSKKVASSKSSKDTSITRKQIKIGSRTTRSPFTPERLFHTLKAVELTKELLLLRSNKIEK